MQSFLLEFGASSLEDVMRTRYYAERTPPYAMRAISRLGYAWHQEFGVALRSYWHDLRTLPDLRRGVMHQQYPQFGIAWPYIKRKHANYRNDKHGKHPYPRPLDCGDGLAVWSAAGKRFAKRINNKRRRAEDRREIALEMDWWACDPQHGDAVDEFDGLAWCYVRSTGLEVYPANVFVPAAPECFDELRGVNLDMQMTSPTKDYQ